MSTRTRAGRGPRVLVASMVASLLLAADPGLALAHPSEDVSLSHMILETAAWSLGVAVVIALIVALLWLRVRLRGRAE